MTEALFDSTVITFAWFDPTVQIIGWFDKDLLSVETGGVIVVTSVGIFDEPWFMPPFESFFA